MSQQLILQKVLTKNIKKDKQMVELIYSLKQGRYPFGRGKQSQYTYMQYLLPSKDQEQTTKYRQLNMILKRLSHPNIMRLQRVLKQQTAFHMVYEFQDKSLEQYLKTLQKQEELATIFVDLENVFEFLIEHKLKAQLYLEYIGVDQSNRLKVWMKPDEIEYMGCTDSDKKIKNNLKEYYETERTRIHLQIEEIFEESDSGSKKQNSPSQTKSGDDSFQSKGKKRNFIIEGNTLKFLGVSADEKQKCERKLQHSQNDSQKHLMSKAHHLVHQQKVVSKTDTTKKPLQDQPHPKVTITIQQPDISKMSVAQKVLYYKKQKQQNSSHISSDSNQNKLVIKDSSTGNMNSSDISKSSNDSNFQIKTEMIAKNRMKIITSQQIQVQGDSDDDIQGLAREKIAQLTLQRQQKNQQHDSSHEINKSSNSGNSENAQRLLKGLDENTREEYQHQQSKQINTKINQAKINARNILDKYCQKLRK